MELWDILDEHGNKTGKIVERGTELEQGEYRLIIDVWIINKDNEFLISKRVPTKQREPDKWNPVCGNVIAGEDSISAALRETEEELGITINAQNGKLIKRFTIWQTAIIDVWLFHQEVDVNTVTLQEDETDDVMWATNTVIKQIIEKGDFMNHGRFSYIDELFNICAL
jgi:isopentenyldiphosphate isomerase